MTTPTLRETHLTDWPEGAEDACVKLQGDLRTQLRKALTLLDQSGEVDPAFGDEITEDCEALDNFLATAPRRAAA